MHAAFAISILALALTYAGVEMMRRWLLHRELLDHPNERSSHSTPTPRGGGAVIFAVCMAAYGAGSVLFHFPFIWAYFVGSFLIAMVSWLDDVYSVPTPIRFAVHLAAAVLAVWQMGSWEVVYSPFGTGQVVLGHAGTVLTVLWIVWMINAYNFMDGIDGIAGIQGVVAAAGWALAGAIGGANDLTFYSAAVGAACLGFLIHNWQPAKIFMGDIGSAFLGYTFALLPLLTLKVPAIERSSPWLAAAFVWLFVFDTVLTLIRRAFRGEKVWTAHRSHIYQRMVVAGRSHAAVSKTYGVLASFVAATALLALFDPSYWFATAIFAVAAAVCLVIFGYFYRGVDL